jgi:hypothetical protein
MNDPVLVVGQKPDMEKAFGNYHLPNPLGNYNNYGTMTTA